jgi:Sec-independent protein secretion pathway component TatC
MKRIRALILRLHVPRVVRIMGKEIGREIKVNNNRSNRRRSFIIRARVVGAIVTPPDVVSQVIVAIPIRVLRERGIFLKCVRLSRNEQEDKSNK